MLNKYLIIILLIILVPRMAWGQGTEIDLSSDTYKDGYTINAGGTYTFTGTYSGTPTQDIDGTKKAVINVATTDEVTIVLDDVNISLTGANQCPLSAKAGGKVTVQLKGENVLSTRHINAQSPALWAPEGGGCELIIQDWSRDEVGSLEVKGGQYAAGIGGGRFGSGGTITISSGKVTATGGSNGAGIGGGHGGDGGTITILGGKVKAQGFGASAGIGGGQNGSGGIITISGGEVTAEGGGNSAGIGGGINGSGGTITISGGEVTAMGHTDAAGIGGGNGGDGGTITISGGKVTAMGEYDGPGIGAGNGGSVASFTTGANGTAIIFANSIGDVSDVTYWKGLIFQGDNGQIYGESFTLATDLEIPNGKTLTLDADKTLAINDGKTLNNLGVIYNAGSITNKGTITGNPIQHAIIYNSNDETPSTATNYIAENSAPAHTGFTRQYYTQAEGWYNAATGGSQVKTITQPITVYAYWTENQVAFSAFPDPITKEYDGTPISITAPTVTGALLPSGGTSTLSYTVKNADSYVTEAPANVGTYTVKASYADANYKPQETTADFEITQKELTVIPADNQVIYLGEEIAYEPIASGFPDETLKCEGQLSVQNGKIVQGTLKLVDNDLFLASNYNLVVKDVACTYINMKPEDATATLSGPSAANGSYSGPVTFTAPTGFTIQLKGSAAGFTPSFTYSQQGTHNVTYELQRKGITYEHTYANLSIKENTPDPDPTPDPVPDPITYYSVTLPAVEGATLNPAPGEHVCEAGEKFTFSLVLDPDYDQSVPVVKVDREELKADSWGHYTFRVQSNVRISIEGIRANAPSALDTPSDGQSRIYTAGSILCIETAQPQQLTILTLGGRLQRTLQVTEGLSRLSNLPHGFYIVRLEDGTTEKVGIGGK